MKKKFIVVAAFASISLASCSNGSSEKPVSDSGSTPKIQHSKEKPIKTGVYVGKDSDYGKESSVTIFEGEVEDCSGLVCEFDVKFRQASDNAIVYTVQEWGRGESTPESTNVFLCSDPKPDLKNFRCGPTGWIQSSIAKPRIVDYITTQEELRVVEYVRGDFAYFSNCKNKFPDSVQQDALNSRLSAGAKIMDKRKWESEVEPSISNSSYGVSFSAKVCGGTYYILETQN